MKFNNVFSKVGHTKSPQNAAMTDDPIQQAKVIVDSIEDGVILFDDKLTIRLFNPASSSISGWKQEDAIGINTDLVVQLIDDKNAAIEPAKNPFHQVFTTGKSISTSDYSLLTRDKQSVPVRLHVSPLMGTNNTVTEAVAVLNNISEEKSEEKQRADFISTASHEMRTPVAAIEGYLALSLNDKVSTIDDRARGYLEKAHNSTEHLGHLFQDLLTSAKAEDGRLTSHPEVVEMSEFLDQLGSDLKLVADQKGLAMDFAAGNSSTINAVSNPSNRVLAPLYYVFIDQDRLREVITNLFDNAVKYTAEGKVLLGITGNDQVVQCYVKDTGAGIPAEDLPHLFQKFYRVDSSATRTIGGTGLGLFICRKIVEQYNGRIWAESEVGKGSTFYINLPRLTTQKAQELQATAAANSPPTA